MDELVERTIPSNIRLTRELELEDPICKCQKFVWVYMFDDNHHFNWHRNLGSIVLLLSTVL